MKIKKDVGTSMTIIGVVLLGLVLLEYIGNVARVNLKDLSSPDTGVLQSIASNRNTPLDSSHNIHNKGK